MVLRVAKKTMSFFQIHHNWNHIAYCALIFLTLSLPSCSIEDRYTSQIPSHKKTIPRKVNEDGVFISHYIPHFHEIGRRKRHVTSDQLHYIVPVDGVDNHVTLWPNIDFFSPGMVVETHHLRGNKSHISVRQPRSTQCHYNGFVKGIDHSRVSLSTCYGLAGHILVPGEEYLIEPSLDEKQSGEHHVHYIYKRSLMKTTSNVTNCGTKGKSHEAYKEREEYEIKYGNKIERSVRNSLYNGINNYGTNQMRLRRDKDETCPELEDTAIEICPPEEKKLSIQAARFMEVLIVVDYKLERLFNQDLETFIYTIFNMVVSNFQDKSIGTQLYVKIVRIIFLTYTLPRLDVSRYSPSAVLMNFCDWQMEINPFLESHPNHHDFAVFITRFAPCHEKVLGLTHMASICRLDKACTVVSEEGLLLANIITHQIGHSLGADHDDGEMGGCAGEEPDGTRYHMNPVISLSSTEWSVCSQQCLIEFINTRISWCLADPPDEHDFKQPDILPGQVYDAIHQCSLNFRMPTVACKTGEFCKELYCQITPSKCASTGDPPAIGTPCAKDMWCFNGVCVHRGQRPGAIDGEWGPWTQWSSCTRSCGGGVQSRYRSCNKPAPYHGGAFCVGDWMSYRMCSIRRCVGYVPSFRQLQCKMTDKRPYRGRIYMWDNFRSFFEDIKCALVCINEKKHVSIRSPVVIDGTPCMPGTNNICIQGNCRKVGCDNVIDSESKEDGCGKCHGNGTECRVVEGVFMDKNIVGVTPFLKLPRHTSMIYLRELDQSTCYFIIGSSQNGSFFLNSPFIYLIRSNEQLPGEFDCGGTSGVYENRMNTERIFIRGAIQIPLTVSLKCSEAKNAGVHFQYALPERELLHTPVYRWYFMYWEECSALCGGGTQRAQAVCIESRSGEVDNKYCYDKAKPKDAIRTCNHKQCSAKWWAGPWSNCDCTDHEGIMTRIVLCMKVPSEDGTFSKVTKEKECCYSPKPRVQRPCNEVNVENSIHRQKREEIKNEDESYGIDLYEPSPRPQQHRRGKHRKQDYIQGEDYGDNFDPRLRNQALHFEEQMTSTDMQIGMHPKKKKMRRKNRRRMNKVHSQNVLEENDSFPTKRKIPRNEHLRPTLIDDLIDGELVQNKERKKEDTSTTTKYTTTTTTEDETKISVTYDSTAVTAIRNEHNTLGNHPYPAHSNLSMNETINLPEGDFFLQDVFVEQISTKCLPRDDKIEPADLGPRYDTGNNTGYKLIVIPIIPNTDIFSLTDYELEVFGDSGYWPFASKVDKVFLTGEKMFKAVNEASKRATKYPLIDLENV